MRYKNEIEMEVLGKALRAIQHEAGVHLEITEEEVRYGAYQIDAVLKLNPWGKKLFAEIKKWAPQANLGVLIDQVRRMPGEGILVADYINPNMAEKLREEQVQYIDTVGNAYIKQPELFVYIKGNPAPKKQYEKKPDAVQRAFEPKGLVLVYAFLCYEWIVDQPYRTIADRAGVAVGTVGWVINALKAGGFIRKADWNGGRKLVNHRELINRWVGAWPQKLKPKLQLGEFQTEDFLWWEEIDITNYHGYWGGEIAAAKYTNNLTPQEVTLYIPKEELSNLLRDARLKKADNWGGTNTYKIHVCERFWPKTVEYLDNGYEEGQGLVHPLLAYADLLATGDVRNLEVAKELYERYIEHEFIPED